jgi:hypothetical protein
MLAPNRGLRAFGGAGTVPCSAREPRFLAILGDGEAGITSIGQAPGFSAEQLIALRGVCHA